MPPRLTAHDIDQDRPMPFGTRVDGSATRRRFLAQARTFAIAAGLLAALGSNFALGQQVAPNDRSSAAARPVRLRGQVLTVTPGELAVKTRAGEVVQLALAPNVVVNEVFPVALADVKPGSFVGVAAMPQADGSQRAIALTVFPESARGVGEGFHPFDLLPGSTMTNATVATVSAAPDGRRLQVRYRDGEKIIVVPPDATVVSFRPGDRSLLVPGASVSLTAAQLDGQPTALRINAGRNGFQLPY